MLRDKVAARISGEEPSSADNSKTEESITDSITVKKTTHSEQTHPCKVADNYEFE